MAFSYLPFKRKFSPRLAATCALGKPSRKESIWMMRFSRFKAPSQSSNPAMPAIIFQSYRPRSVLPKKNPTTHSRGLSGDSARPWAPSQYPTAYGFPIGVSPKQEQAPSVEGAFSIFVTGQKRAPSVTFQKRSAISACQKLIGQGFMPRLPDYLTARWIGLTGNLLPLSIKQGGRIRR